MKKNKPEITLFIKQQVHEINNSLSIISGYNEIIRGKCLDKKVDIKKDIKDIKKSVTRIHEAIHEILQYFIAH